MVFLNYRLMVVWNTGVVDAVNLIDHVVARGYLMMESFKLSRMRIIALGSDWRRGFFLNNLLLSKI